MPAKPSDRFIPWYFVAFFAAQAVLFAWFAHVAYSTYTGVVMDDAYNVGVKYNNVIASADAQQRLGWKMDVATRRENGKTVFTVTLADRSGAPISGADVRLWLYRPSQEKLDRRLVLRETGAGVYAVEGDVPAPGLWELRAEAVKDGKSFQSSQRAEL